MEDEKFRIVAKVSEKIPMKEQFHMKEFGFEVSKSYNEEPNSVEEEEKRLYEKAEKVLEQIKNNEQQKKNLGGKTW